MRDEECPQTFGSLKIFNQWYIWSEKEIRFSFCFPVFLFSVFQIHGSVQLYFRPFYPHTEDFHGGSDGKASAYNAGDPGLIPGLGRSSGEGNGNPLQYSCLKNLMDGGAL